MKHFHRPKQTLSAADELFEYKSLEKKKLKIAAAITCITMLVEIIGGIFTNSLALISDAGHMFTHFFALAISGAALVCADRPVCHHRTFGFYRIEILAAFFNSIFIFAVTAWIFIEGVHRIIQPKTIIGFEMFIIAVIGLVVNLITAWILHGAAKESLNIKSAFVHMLADTFSSVAIVIGAIVIYFTKWNIIDPILSIAIACVILIWGWGLFRDSANILLEAAPKGIDSDKVRTVLMEQVKEIEEITDMHIWEITSKMYSMTAHIKIKGDEKCVDVKKILGRIKQIVNDEFDIEHTTIELD
ncbi:MAG: cation diffusion facilitator family transporter [Candidatus Omnitrophica bacterium]|jgi:cobalt-zinc-cadmium efflux system protein|nr:cation diffusion facilitator family transporter [Candidatus Omnitrophota bacterium]